MRVAVIGAGSVGGTIAALLDRAGHDVEVTARGQHLDAIQNHGLRLSGAWGEHTARVLAGEVLSRAPELAIVATKAPDTRNAIRDNAKWLGGIPVVVVQNGMRALDTAEHELPRAAVIGGLALFAASLVSPGNVRVTTDGATYIGARGGGPSVARLSVTHAAQILGEALPVVATDDFAGAQWSKLVVNQINALPAITGMSAQEVVGDRALRRVLTRGMREAVRVGFAHRIRFARLQGLSHGLLRAFLAVPPWLSQLLPLAMKWRMGKTPNPGSTLQSIRRGQKSEIDYLNGAVVEAGAAVGVATPVNAALTAMVHEVEDTGTFLSPTAVLDRISGAASVERG